MTPRVHKPVIALAMLEGMILLASFYVGLSSSWVQMDSISLAFLTFLPRGIIYVLVFLSAMLAVGMYRRRHFASFADTIIRLSVGIFLSLAALSVIFYVFPFIIIWRAIFLPATSTAFIALLATRFFALRVMHFHQLKRRIMVIGVCKRAARIEALERERQALGFVTVGYVPLGEKDVRVSRSKIMSNNKPLADLPAHHLVNEVVVAADEKRGRLPMRELMDWRSQGVMITNFETFHERETGAVELNSLNWGWFVFTDGFRNGVWRQASKRGIDIAASLSLLILFLPLIACTAVAIWLESRGPVILRQTRIGAKGIPFVLLKFRSMNVGAETDGTPKWAQEKDLRITKVGAFIRRYRIDEIPQILNVLQGSMSFVGPRPERPYFVEQLSQQIQFYNERHRIKPGITGWAQLNYQYGASNEHSGRKLEYDLYYLRYNTIFLDLVIILQTVGVVLWRQGAR